VRRASLLRATPIEVAAFVTAMIVTCMPLSAAAQNAPKGASLSVPRVEADPAPQLLDSGFHSLYELNFEGARAEFLAYQELYPTDPLGKAAEAASYLYEQFNDKGVLTSSFFLDDSKFLGGVEGNPSKNRNASFLATNRQAHELAQERVKQDPRDPGGLLGLTLTDGMESDYDAIIEKKQLAGLSLMRRAESEANALLEVDPEAQDAYVALGTSNYVIGCMPVYKRAFLWFGGVHGDRARGMQQLDLASRHGRYLRPFAMIMLALAAEREHQMDRARALLTDLTREFPANPIFAHELTLLDERMSKGR
jgi:hypothetical protein